MILDVGYYSLAFQSIKMYWYAQLWWWWTLGLCFAVVFLLGFFSSWLTHSFLLIIFLKKSLQLIFYRPIYYWIAFQWLLDSLNTFLPLCITKQLLIFNILHHLLKIWKIFFPHQPYRLALFLHGNDKAS